jgi:hypothetical protein
LPSAEGDRLLIRGEGSCYARDWRGRERVYRWRESAPASESKPEPLPEKRRGPKSGICRYCGRETGGIVLHERYCKARDSQEGQPSAIVEE